MKTTAITRIRLHALALLLFLSLVVVKPAVMIATAAAPFAFAAQLVLVAAVFLGPGLAVRPFTGGRGVPEASRCFRAPQ